MENNEKKNNLIKVVRNDQKDIININIIPEQSLLKEKNEKNNYLNLNKSFFKDKEENNNLINKSIQKTSNANNEINILQNLINLGNNLQNQINIEENPENNNLMNKSNTKANNEINILQNLFNLLPNNKTDNLENQSELVENQQNINSVNNSIPLVNNEFNILQNLINLIPNQENNNLPNQDKISEKQENNNSSNKSFSKTKNEINISKNSINDLLNESNLENINYETFPKDTKYEIYLNKNFKYFNVFWYDSKVTKDFNNFKKCFEKVEFNRGYNLYSTIDFFKKQSIDEWIIITSGSDGKELILNLEKFKCIKSFFIFCGNIEYHKEWAKKIKKVGCLTSDPEFLCKKLIEINKKYIIPNFNYKNIKNNDELKNFDDIDIDDMKLSNPQVIKFVIGINNKYKNKYNNLCIKLINYLNSEQIKNDLKAALAEQVGPLHMMEDIMSNLFSGIEFEMDAVLETNVEISKYLILLSLYFSKYPYLLNLLSLKEVINIFHEEIPPTFITEFSFKIYPILKKFYQKIMNNECILNKVAILRELQIGSIRIIAYSLKSKDNNLNLDNFYQIMNYFRDLDFCLKLLSMILLAVVNGKNYNILDEINFALITGEPRYTFYIIYLNQNIEETKFNENEQKISKDSVSIKDFIVIGDNELGMEFKTS